MTTMLTAPWPPGDREIRDGFRHANLIIPDLLPFPGCICQHMKGAIQSLQPERLRSAGTITRPSIMRFRDHDLSLTINFPGPVRPDGRGLARRLRGRGLLLANL